jgi:uncharacterized heparinase superfamily protein
MYHSLVLEDVLDLVALVRAAPTAFGRPERTETWLTGVADHMRVWLAAMCHPDGEIGLFNDSAFGQAPSPAALGEYAGRLGRPAAPQPSSGATLLAASGYVRVDVGPAVAILDVGEIGPKYLPGHAHADTLSFELSVDGERVVVDSGTSVYERGDERLRQRGTAAHNTIEIDGADSSEIWSSFRVARRAVPAGLHLDDTPGAVVVSCAHDGYRRLPGRAVHARTWSFRADGALIDDRVEGRFESAVGRIHLHPEIAACAEAGAVALRHEVAREVRVESAGAPLSIESGTWHPGFGHSIPNEHLRCALPPGASSSLLRLAW